MVSGKTVEEIVELAGTEKGLGAKEEERVLDKLKLFWNRMSLPSWMPGLTHIVTVPSLNIEGANHRIVIDVNEDLEYKIYDPNEGRAGKKYYTINNLKTWSEVVVVKPY